MLKTSDIDKLIQNKVGKVTSGVSWTYDDAYSACNGYISKNKPRMASLGKLTPQEENMIIERIIDDYVSNVLENEIEGFAGADGIKALRVELTNDIVKYKCITEMMEDSDVTEIRINKFDEIFYEKSGKTIKSERTFRNEQEAELIVSKMIGTGKKLGAAEPFIDSRTAIEKFRINATASCISPNGATTCVIRKFMPKDRKFTAKDLIERGTLSDNMATLLKLLPECGASIVTVGGTGSGKTVSNEAIIINNIHPSQRRVFIENPAELTPQVLDDNGKNIADFIQLEAQRVENPTVKDPTPANLVNNSLRQTPKWIVMGESRANDEFQVLLTAALTGHSVITTYHAEYDVQAMERYLQAILAVSGNLPPEVAMGAITSAFQFIVVCTRYPDGKRRISQITEIVGSDGIKPLLNPIYKYVINEVHDDGTYVGRHKRVGAISNKIIDKFKNSLVPDSRYIEFTKAPDENLEIETYMYLDKPSK